MISLLWSEGELKSQAFLPQLLNEVLHLKPLQLHKYELFNEMLQFCMLTSLQIKGRQQFKDTKVLSIVVFWRYNSFCPETSAMAFFSCMTVCLKPTEYHSKVANLQSICSKSTMSNGRHVLI